jgi:hypothetical protein
MDRSLRAVGWLACCQNGLFLTAIRMVPVCTAPHCTQHHIAVLWLLNCYNNPVLKWRLVFRLLPDLLETSLCQISNLHAQIVLQMHLAANLDFTGFRTQTVHTVNRNTHPSGALSCRIRPDCRCVLFAGTHLPLFITDYLLVQWIVLHSAPFVILSFYLCLRCTAALLPRLFVFSTWINKNLIELHGIIFSSNCY